MLHSLNPFLTSSRPLSLYINWKLAHSQAPLLQALLSFFQVSSL
uniref:Uncharacterized protein n=1 Tax=Manihot esculenta TaxID=3983 RepID=A0A2C9U879_MANES